MLRTAEILVLIFAAAYPAGLAAQTYPSARPGYAPAASAYGRGVVSPVHYETPGTRNAGVVPVSYDSSLGTPARSAGAFGTQGATAGLSSSAEDTSSAALPSPLPRRESVRPLPPRSGGTGVSPVHGQDARGTQGRGLPSMNTLAGSLGIVLGIFFALAWIMRRFAPQGLSILPGEAFEVLGRAPLAGRQQAHLLRLGNKLLLVSVTPTGAETLGEVTDPDEVERLTALCRRPAERATETLRQVFGQWTEPQPPDVEPYPTSAAGGAEDRHG